MMAVWHGDFASAGLDIVLLVPVCEVQWHKWEVAVRWPARRDQMSSLLGFVVVALPALYCS